MAILDGINKAIGKATQGISDATLGLIDATKGISDNLPLLKAKTKNVEHISKCPQCGELLNGISAVCPSCGYELREIKAASSVSQLVKEIDNIESKRNTIVDTLASKIAGHSIHPTEDRIASLIRNYVVPNTKEDIFEFMLLASSNIDAKILAGKKKIEGVPEVIIKAWESKFEQTYRKAKISFGDDPDFKKIKEIYEEKKREIDKAKSIFNFGRK